MAMWQSLVLIMVHYTAAKAGKTPITKAQIAAAAMLGLPLPLTAAAVVLERSVQVITYSLLAICVAMTGFIVATRKPQEGDLV